MIDHMTVSAVARELGPSRDTVNAIAKALPRSSSI